MERETNSLLLKSNRVLGTRLVEAGLVNLADMDKANEIFVERVRAKDLRRASLLWILVYESQALEESRLWEFQLEQFGLGAVLLENYSIDPVLATGRNIDLMRASWTVPIDHQMGKWFLASAYYISDVVRTFWEEQLGQNLVWSVAPLQDFEAVLDVFAAAQNAAEEGK